MIKIRHKETKKTIVGVWDLEGLEFLYDGGSIYYHDFKENWQEVNFVKKTSKNKILINQILLIDLPLRGSNKKITIPLKRIKTYHDRIKFKPLYGKIPYKYCSLFGVVRGINSKVYEKPENVYLKDIILKFADLIKCHHCLGLEQKCNYCLN